MPSLEFDWTAPFCSSYSSSVVSTTTTTMTHTMANNNDTDDKKKKKNIDYIHLRSHSNLPQLTSRLQEGQYYLHSEQLTVVCPGCEPDWLSPEVTSLLRGFRHLKQLQELKLNCVGLLDVAFPLQLLTELVQSCAPSLESLELDDVALTTSSEEEVTALAQAIERRASGSSGRSGSSNFTQFRLFGCLADDTLPQAESPTSSVLTPLWASLATLTHVELDAVDDGLLGSIPAPTIGHLARSNTLKHLHFNGFALNNDCLMQLAEALQHNQALLELSLDLYSVGHPGQGAFALADSLRANRHLQRLHLSISHAWNDEDFLRALAVALRVECTLQSLIIGTCATIRDSTAQVFADTLSVNCVLQEAQLSRYAGKYKPLMQYYLKLNSQRRGYFHASYGSLPRSEWIEGLIGVKQDLNGLYYFLHMNPSLYCAGGDSGSNVELVR